MPFLQSTDSPTSTLHFAHNSELDSHEAWNGWWYVSAHAHMVSVYVLDLILLMVQLRLVPDRKPSLLLLTRSLHRSVIGGCLDSRGRWGPLLMSAMSEQEWSQRSQRRYLSRVSY
jgi:hypothetical protein